MTSHNNPAWGPREWAIDQWHDFDSISIRVRGTLFSSTDPLKYKSGSNISTTTDNHVKLGFKWNEGDMVPYHGFSRNDGYAPALRRIKVTQHPWTVIDYDWRTTQTYIANSIW